jgi:hypothetical protein
MDTILGWAKDVLDAFIVNPSDNTAIWATAIVLALAVRYARGIFVGLVRAFLR